ncbi:MAG: hypothetical protein JNJ57_15205, partial [Saprospiraceae bacterium]|nr:hypothetical protein [Saprospiraceae bacterium]
MKEFLKFALQCLLVAAILKNCFKSTSAANEPPPPEPDEVEIVPVIPPPPKIQSPQLAAPEKDLTEKVLAYFQGPCDPIIPSFKEAHQLRPIRPLVTAVIAEKHVGSFNLGQVCDVYDHLYFKWKPLDDPSNHELVCAASAVWEAPGGDCDDFSVCLSAALSSINGVTLVTFAYNRARKGHAYVEVCLGTSVNQLLVENYLRARYNLADDVEIHTRADDSG